MLCQIEQAQQLQTIALTVENGAQVAGLEHGPTGRSLVGGQLERRFLPRRGGLGTICRDRCAKIQKQIPIVKQLRRSMAWLLKH